MKKVQNFISRIYPKISLNLSMSILGVLGILAIIMPLNEIKDMSFTPMDVILEMLILIAYFIFADIALRKTADKILGK